jgi:hypothetical protein
MKKINETYVVEMRMRVILLLSVLKLSFVVLKSMGSCAFELSTKKKFYQAKCTEM